MCYSNKSVKIFTLTSFSGMKLTMPLPRSNKIAKCNKKTGWLIRHHKLSTVNLSLIFLVIFRHFLQITGKISLGLYCVTPTPMAKTKFPFVVATRQTQLQGMQQCRSKHTLSFGSVSNAPN